jgi:CHAT domain-containing protein
VASILIRKWLVTLFITTLILALYFGKATTFAGNQLSVCSKLTQELSFPEAICQGTSLTELELKLSTIGLNQNRTLHQLGITLRQLRYLENSETVLTRALKNDPNNESIALSLANLQQQAYRRSIYKYKSSDEGSNQIASVRDGLKYANLGLKSYLSLSKNLTTEDQIFAGLNWLSLWSSLEPEILGFKELQQQQSTIAKSFIVQLQRSFPTIDVQRQTEARLSFAEALLKSANPSFEFLSLQNTEIAIRSTSDLKLLSKAYGIKGQIIQKTQPENAIIEFGKALSAAQSIRESELSYKWQWALAKLYEKTGNTQQALNLYEASLGSINQIRDGILQLNLEIQYDFRDLTEPIYRQYIGLILKSPNPNIEKVLRVNDQLRIAELENYLQCSRLKLTSLLDIPKTMSADANLYIIKLPNRYAVIVRQKNGEFKYRTLESKAIDQSLRVVRQSLQNDRFYNLPELTYKENFGSLYQSLFRPIDDLIPPKGTIVIAADSQLQNIPWAILYDAKSQQYLVERYSIAYSLGSELSNSKQLQELKLKVLIAGLSEQTNELIYSALPNVLKEVEEIQFELKTKVKKLLNKNFTISKLIQESKGFSVFHFATHGQYSSNPNQSFILGWNERITLSELQNLVRIRNSGLDLLVLSACEAAKGDNRATLGIAGASYQAGAQSTVATLWLVEDEAQSKLMGAFYAALKEGKNKADALRTAQLSLLNSREISNRNPFLWGSPILLGSWQ